MALSLGESSLLQLVNNLSSVGGGVAGGDVCVTCHLPTSSLLSTVGSTDHSSSCLTSWDLLCLWIIVLVYCVLLAFWLYSFFHRFPVILLYNYYVSSQCLSMTQLDTR